MGRPKMALPWGEGGTLISHMVDLFIAAGSDRVLVVTGGDREAVEGALTGSPAQLVYNPDYRAGGMISSIKVGLRTLQGGPAETVAISPADLPYLKVSTLQALYEGIPRAEGGILAPSYRGRRGHPVLIGKGNWSEILDLPSGETLRDYLRARAEDIEYLEVYDPGLIQDLDTPEDLAEEGRGSG